MISRQINSDGIPMSLNDMPEYLDGSGQRRVQLDWCFYLRLTRHPGDVAPLMPSFGTNLGLMQIFLV